MTALTSSYVGSVETIDRDLRPVAGGQKTYAGHVCVANPGGTKPGFYGEATGALGEVPVGRFYGQYGAVDNTSGADGDLSADVQFFRERTVMLVNNDTGGGALTNAQREGMVSIKDAITATIDTGGPALADFGLFYDFSEDGSGQVWIELPYPSSAQDQGASPAPATSNVARVASTGGDLAAYVGSGTSTLTAAVAGAIGAQDGVTPVVGDVILLHIGCTNLTALKDAGPWQVTAVGGVGKWVLVRPSWWFTGGKIPNGASIQVSEGTKFAGTSWRVHAVKGKIIDTDDPDLFPKSVTLQVTMNGASPSLFAITTVPLRSVTKSNAISMYAGAGAPAATTLAYQPGVITPATLGNCGSVTVSAVKAAMAGVNADTALVNVTIENQ